MITVKTPNWQRIVRALIDGGMTQVQVAEQLGCRQSFVSKLYNGTAKAIRYEVGVALLLLRDRRVKHLARTTR